MFRLIVLFSFFNCFISNPINDSIDWRMKGAVLPVINQGSCGSASIFSALDAISSAQQIKHGNLVRLSTQQIYDCSGDLCPCEGSWSLSQIYQMIFDEKQNRQLDSEQSYPYTGKCDYQCKFKQSGAVTQLIAYESYSGNSSLEKELSKSLESGPVAIDIEVNTKMELYSGGIFDDSTCKGDQLNHSLLLIGDGTENGVDYWIAKNSWGKQWGEDGYIRIVKGKGMCGIGKSYVRPEVA